MSEEEIRTRIYNLIQASRLGALRDENFKEEYEKDKQALEGILDLYQKEKENNKKKSIAIIEYQDLLENSISKDKIREKIKEFQEELDEGYLGDNNIRVNKFVIEVLQELLEENKSNENNI